MGVDRNALFAAQRELEQRQMKIDTLTHDVSRPALRSIGSIHPRRVVTRDSDQISGERRTGERDATRSGLDQTRTRPRRTNEHPTALTHTRAGEQYELLRPRHEQILADHRLSATRGAGEARAGAGPGITTQVEEAVPSSVDE